MIVCLAGQAQIYISSGKIVYERKVNVWAGISDNFFEGFKEAVPQWQTDNFVLSFTTDKTLYKPEGEVRKRLFNMPASDNVVYTDLKKGIRISAKNIFDKNYLIQNSLRHAVWKIKDDFREIAGFNCRRATTIILDSVFVVAFYAEEIIPSTGPESFGGLPGAILGLVINRLHTAWYATRVEATEFGVNNIIPPSTGNIISEAQLRDLLEKAPVSANEGIGPLLWSVEI